MNLFKQNVVVLDRGEYTNCTVNLHGATITSWRVENKEQLFLSKLAVYDNKQAIRGGIQMIFPHYGAWEFGLHHGFARITCWKVEKDPEKLLNDDVEAIFSLSDDAFTSSIWSFSFKIIFQVILREKELYTNLTIENPSVHYTIKFDILQNVYIKVPAIKHSHLIGLKNQNYFDQLNDNVLCEDKREYLVTRGHIDRLYLNTPDEMIMTNIMSGNKLKIKKSNYHELAVWNPGKKRYHLLTDFDDDEYKRMLSMAFGANAVVLLPGQKFEGSLTLTIIEVEDSNAPATTYIQLIL